MVVLSPRFLSRYTWVMALPGLMVTSSKGGQMDREVVWARAGVVKRRKRGRINRE